jgi:glyoxylase-like metal-dependent hydrolase (beta-lactamase superfamily II)
LSELDAPISASDARVAPALIDLQWMGRTNCIAAWLTRDVLVDCGPATTLDTLLDALGDRQPRALLLTHIHFDHAGAAGALVQRWPNLEVWVHRRGTRHLAAPGRLEASARRVFGDTFDERFGSLTPIPERNLRPLDGGESVYGYRVLDTPGHASHHVTYLDDATGRAFVGDVAATRLFDAGPVLPATPPPDIDIDIWLDSLRVVISQEPTWLGLPHFGAVQDPLEHLDAAMEAVRRHAELARSLDCDAYVRRVRDELSARLEPDAVAAHTLTVDLPQNHAGLRRWTERGG